MKWALHILSTLLLAPSVAVTAGEIGGQVVDSLQSPVSGATVLLCDQATGIPIDSDTLKPFQRGTNLPPHLATAVTDERGRFRFHSVSNGLYRLVSQSWTGTPSVRDIFEVHGKEIHLRGAVNSVRVPSPQALDLLIQPPGTASASLNEHFGNDDSLLVISPMPLSTDPILGFTSWQGPFLQHAIGINRMPGGVTYIHGLPEGRIHLSIFSNDNNGGIGEGMIEARAGETVVSEYIPIVCSWSNGRHDPPPPLQATFREMKGIMGNLKPKQTILPFLKKLLAKENIKVRQNRKAPFTPYLQYLTVAVTLPSGARVPFRDVLASLQYLGLQRSLEARKIATTKSPPPPPNSPRGGR